MIPYLSADDLTIYVGDVRQVLAELDAGSIDCVVTSPPYWNLRDYGSEHQIGLEETPAEYVENLVGVFREIRRVLAPHGTAWLNLGDTYAGKSAGAWGNGKSTLRDGRTYDADAAMQGRRDDGARDRRTPGLKDKDLVGIPWRVAFALQADGWHLRADVIWSKANPMPSSAGDRPTISHEYVFLLAKRRRYYFDQEAVRERYAGRAGEPPVEPNLDQLTLGDLPPEAPRGPDGRRKVVHDHGSAGAHENYVPIASAARWAAGGRNVRSVWTLPLQPFPGAHFATMPERLADRCVAASAPARVCRTCGKPSTRIVKKTADPENSQRRRNPPAAAMTAAGEGRNGRDSETFGEIVYTETVGWTDCGHDNWRRGVVLDPFGGSGTTALVTRRRGLVAVAVELNPEYAEMLVARNSQTDLSFEETP